MFLLNASVLDVMSCDLKKAEPILIKVDTFLSKNVPNKDYKI
jgi:hypothetical protein